MMQQSRKLIEYKITFHFIRTVIGNNEIQRPGLYQLKEQDSRTRIEPANVPVVKLEKRFKTRKISLVTYIKLAETFQLHGMVLNHGQ